MKRLFKILAILALILVVVFGAVFFMTSGARETARTFVFNISSGAFEDALAMLHQETAAEFPLERMQDVFGSAQPYTEVSFTSVQTSNGQTGLTGTATTAEGCTSAVEFSLIADKIVGFNFEPLCRNR